MPYSISTTAFDISYPHALTRPLNKRYLRDPIWPSLVAWAFNETKHTTLTGYKPYHGWVVVSRLRSPPAVGNILRRE